MLSVQKILYTRRYSSACACNMSNVFRHAVGGGRIIDRSYGIYVPDKFIMTEGQKKKFAVDPNVKPLRNSLLHSDYLQRKTMRFGKTRNTIELSKMRRKYNQQCYNDLIEKPVMSIALKYMQDATVSTPNSRNNPAAAAKENITERKESSNTKKPTESGAKDSEDADLLVFKKKNGMPIHMPYAATDKYEILEEEEAELESKFKMPVLNNTYKALYEKYLKSKETELNDEVLTKLFRKEVIEKSHMKNLTVSKPFENIDKVPANWMADYQQYNDTLHEDDSWKARHGTPNRRIPVSTIPCGGCGALLHCRDPELPGYLPSQLFAKGDAKILKSSTCQRCHFMKNYDTTLDVKVSPDDYPNLLGHLKKRKVAVIMMIDLTDFPCSIWPGIMDILGKTTQVFVVGNKVDLLPNDGVGFFKRVEDSLVQSVREMGIAKANIKSVNLISAKTGFGVERLINKLHRVWGYKGDVYMIGCTNVGKSSLFNALLQSDYCKVQAIDLVQRATVSPWPGTTLNLLKFPILNPVRWRLYERFRRIRFQQESVAEDEAIRNELYWDSKNPEFLTLQGHIGRTFDRKKVEGQGYTGKIEGADTGGYLGLDESDEEFKETRWFYDTPGTMHPDQVLDILTTEELMKTLPERIISPRSFQIDNYVTLFVAGLGRIDNLGGYDSIICTVFASGKLPVTICETRKADELYKKLLKTEALAVPINDPDRLKVFPALQGQDFTVDGIGEQESAADVVLSSIGWVAITAKEGQPVNIRAWTPQGRGLYLRSPALLSRSVALRGPKKFGSAAFKPGQQIYAKR